MIVHRVDKILGADTVLHPADFSTDAGVALDGGAELGGFGQAGGGHTHGDDLGSVDLHFPPVIEIEQGEGLGDVHHLFGEGVLEDGVVHAFGHERRVDAETDALLVGDGVSGHQANRIREADDLHLGFQWLAGDDSAVLHVVGNSTELFEEGFRAEEHGEAVAADLGVVGIKHTDGSGDIEAVDGPPGEDIHRPRVHAHGEDRGGVLLLESFAELLDFRLKGTLAVLFDAGRDIAVRGHVDVMGTGFGAGSEDRIVHLAGAGVDGDEDFLFLEEGGEGDRIGRVEFDDFEPAIVGLRRQSLGELGIRVAEVDLAETVVSVEALTNDGTDSSRP